MVEKNSGVKEKKLLSPKKVLILFLFVLIGLYKSSGFYACSVCYETALIDRIGSFGIAFFSHVETEKNDIYKFVNDKQIVPVHKHDWHCYEISLTNIFLYRQRYPYRKYHPLMMLDNEKMMRFYNFYRFFGKENTQKLFFLYRDKKISFENIFLKGFPHKKIKNSKFISWCRRKVRIKILFPSIVLDDNQKWLEEIYRNLIDDESKNN